MAYWKEWVDERGRKVYQENISLDYSELANQPQEEGREVLVLRSVWLPIPHLSGLYRFQDGVWSRTMSLSDLGKVEMEYETSQGEA